MGRRETLITVTVAEELLMCVCLCVCVTELLSLIHETLGETA